MKPILFILAILFASTTVFAQSFSTGLRTGVSQWIHLGARVDNDNIIQSGSDWNSWNQSIFGRYESKKHFALELEAMHFSFNPTLSSTVVWDDYPGPLRQFNYQTHNRTIAFAISPQYRIGRGKLKQYIGPVLTYEIVRDQASFDETYSVRGQLTHQSYTYDGSQNYLGLVYYISYPVYKGFSVHSQADFKIDPGLVFTPESLIWDHGYPNAKFSINVGGSYSF